MTKPKKGKSPCKNVKSIDSFLITSFILYTEITGSVAERTLKAIDEIVATLIKNHKNNISTNLNLLKTRISSQHNLSKTPKLVDIIAAVPADYRSVLLPTLKAKPIRTASGIAVVAVMCKPHRCPHIAMTGNICVYCPGGPDSDFEYSTQSYTGYEPTSMRAIRLDYNVLKNLL